MGLLSRTITPADSDDNHSYRSILKPQKSQRWTQPSSIDAVPDKVTRFTSEYHKRSSTLKDDGKTFRKRHLQITSKPPVVIEVDVETNEKDKVVHDLLHETVMMPSGTAPVTTSKKAQAVKKSASSNNNLTRISSKSGAPTKRQRVNTKINRVNSSLKQLYNNCKEEQEEVWRCSDVLFGLKSMLDEDHKSLNTTFEKASAVLNSSKLTSKYDSKAILNKRKQQEARAKRMAHRSSLKVN